MKGNLEIPIEIPAFTFRNALGEILDRVRYNHERFIVRRRDKPVAIVMGIEDYMNLLETIDEELDPNFQKAMRESYRDYKKGRFTTLERYLAEGKS
jgi:prevent-host-death family protein